LGGPESATGPLAAPGDTPAAAPTPRLANTPARKVSVAHFREGFLDPQLRREQSRHAAWEVRSRVLDELERIFLGSDGQNPRAAVRNVDVRLSNLEERLSQTLEARVLTVNDLGRQIVALNRDRTSMPNASQASDAAGDALASLVERLSRLVPVHLERTYSGAINVRIDGADFVTGTELHELSSERNRDKRYSAGVVRAETGAPLKISGGEVGALIEARDGWLSEIRRDPGVPPDHPSTPVSVPRDQRSGGMTAGNSARSAHDHTSPSEIQLRLAAADTLDGGSVVGRSGAGGDAFVKTLAARCSEARERAEAQGLLVDQLANLRWSAAGTSLDAELANLMQCQQAYEAAARAIMTMDEAIEAVVTGMDLVER